MELDIFTSRALQDHKNGLSPSLRKLAVNPEELEYFKRHIPEYYEVFDVRKPADKYVDDKLFDII